MVIGILKKIIKLDHEIWRDPKRFKAYLLDFMPEDRVERNLLLLCVEIGIPKRIYDKDSIDKFEFYSLRKDLINSIGCDEEKASSLINMWIDAFEIELNDTDETINNVNINFSAGKDIPELIMISDLGDGIEKLPEYIVNAFHKVHIYTLGDLSDFTYKELKKIRGVPYADLDFVIAKMEEYGLKLKKEPDYTGIYKTSICELNLDEALRKRLLDNDIHKIEDIINLDQEQFISIGNKDVETLKEIVTTIALMGVPYNVRKHLNKAILSLINSQSHMLSKRDPAEEADKNNKWIDPGIYLPKTFGDIAYSEPQGWDNKESSYIEGIYYYPYKDAVDGMIWISRQGNVMSQDDFDYEGVINGLCKNKDDLIDVIDCSVSNHKGKIAHYYMKIDKNKMELRSYIIPLNKYVYGFFFGEKNFISNNMLNFEKEFIEGVTFKDKE